ncbi:MAG: flagellin FliC [Gammaproteobacteria bacterium CG22_combo_CG10-13_8_21_14_all_40_8]|nr:MAG: flagellin FliC [Gammaproteobacteria bacterium CG22_combo_CG10-13_8_21_14_all_40_8]
MANFIQTNVSSLNAQRNLTKSNDSLGVALQRLSSGLRINSAKDDAAGLQISNRLTSQINGLTQAQRNANDGISLAQVAEGALNETTNILQRIRTLAIQSANGSNSTADRITIQAEVGALVSEIDRIANDTSFGTTNLLSGGFGAGTAFQVGAEANQTITIKISSRTAGAIGVSGLSVSSVTNAQATIGKVDTAIALVDSTRGALGAFQNRLTSTIANLANIAENVSAARARIRDADFATESANLAKNQVLQQAGLSILSQANASSQSVLSLLRQ